LCNKFTKEVKIYVETIYSYQFNCSLVAIVLLAIYAKPCPEGEELECETDYNDIQTCDCVAG
jgi:hypothetical protein